jgi:transcription factor CRZ1
LLGNPSFHGHRRAPSEHSDVSSAALSSAAHSPYMAQLESFDAGDAHQSPLLTAQDDSSLYDHLAIDSFTISGPQNQKFSPAHSPYISPQLMPQQGGDLGMEPQYLSAQPAGGQIPSVAADMYDNSGESQMVTIQTPASTAEMGHASQMVPPPSINVELAPPSKNQPFVPTTEADVNLLLRKIFSIWSLYY